MQKNWRRKLAIVDGGRRCNKQKRYLLLCLDEKRKILKQLNRTNAKATHADTQNQSLCIRAQILQWADNYTQHCA
jgi:hypothetical protein